MSDARPARARRGAVAFLFLAGLIAILAIAVTRDAGAAPGYTSTASGGLTAQPVLGFPASGATVIGASNADAANAGEVWAEGRIGDVPATLPDGSQVAATEVLVRRTEALGNWRVESARDAGGKPLATGWSAATVTAAGAVVLAGITAAPGAPADPAQILVRPPDESGFAAVAPVPAEDLEAGEAPSSISTEGPPILAATDEAGGTGVFVAPTKESATAPGLLHYAGASAAWAREPICATDVAGTCAPPSAPIVVDAISASSPENAWMVATPAGATGDAATPQLYRRVPATWAPGYVWLAQPGAGPLLASGSGLVLPGTEAKAGTNRGALITASGTGVWLDLVKLGDAGSATLFYSAGTVVGYWCSEKLPCEGATGTLPADLPAGYGSTVTAPASGTSAGGRAITGLPHGAMMALEPNASSFAYRITAGGESEAGETVTPDYSGGNTVGPGGETLAPFLREGVPGVGGGAAFSGPADAWLGVGDPTPGPQLTHLTGSPGESILRPWPVPALSTPLLAIAGQPGTNAAGGEGEAIAVGASGDILRYRPGGSWSPEAVLESNGAQIFTVPTLRGVAWPTPEDAYAVGDGGTMLRRQSAREAWEVDPGKPAGLEANLTGVAFSVANPGVGYAVGKGGVLLSFAAGSWQQEPAPARLEGADFSSVAFAGEEAIAAYRLPGAHETGGLIVNDGSGWQIDPSLPALFAKAKLAEPVLTEVAGLPDGGAVAAGPGLVVERESAAAPWRFSPSPLGELEEAGVSALAATRDSGGQIRALVSVDPDPTEAPNAPGSAWNAADTASPPRPDPEPNQGFLVQETAGGWVDEELEDFPGIDEPAPGPPVDQPGWPDGVYAILTDSSGGSGWTVGGQTGGTRTVEPDPSSITEESVRFYASRVNSAARFGPGPTPPVGEGPPWPSFSNQAGGPERIYSPTFAVAGGSGCNAPCADGAEGLLGPNADLAAALSEAGQIAGLRGFVDAGRGVGWTAGPEDGSEAFARELDQWGSVLSGDGSGLPVYAVPNGPPDRGPGGDIQSPQDEALYRSALGSHVPVSGSVGPAPPEGTAAYAVDTQGAGGGTVRLITLDFSQGNSAADQESWLAAELAEAHAAGEPTLVTGADNITDPGAPNHAADAEAIVAILDSGLASGYVYDSLDHTNTLEEFGPGDQMTAVGVGTLGYGNAAGGRTSNPGFLLVALADEPKSAYPNGRQPLFVSGEITVDGQVSLVGGPPKMTMKSGEAALFGGSVRRVQGGAGGIGTRPRWFGLPGVNCANEINCLIYAFDGFFSSDTTVGEFVVAKNRSEPDVPYVDDKTGKVVGGTSEGLFCATSPGTTTVTFDAGGKTYSEQITVEPGPPSGPCPQEVTALVAPTRAKPSEPPAASEPHPPAPGPPAPAHPHHPAPHHPRPAPPGRPLSHHLPQSAPAAPSEGAPPAQPAPSTAAPKAPPTSGGTPPQPVPPSGISGAPSPAGANVPANVPASTPTTVPLQVPALERRSSAEVGYERAFHHFAAYRPDDGSETLPAIALLLLVLAGGGAIGVAAGPSRFQRRTAISTRGGTRMEFSKAVPRDDRRGRR